MMTGDGGERFVGEAARVSGGEARDLHCRNIRRRTAEAALHRRRNAADEAHKIAIEPATFRRGLTRNLT